MALVHKSKKITHCLTATKHYMRGLFATLSHMYEEGAQTDLTLVAANGVPISVHKVSQAPDTPARRGQGEGRKTGFPPFPVQLGPSIPGLRGLEHGRGGHKGPL